MLLILSLLPKRDVIVPDIGVTAKFLSDGEIKKIKAEQDEEDEKEEIEKAKQASLNQNDKK